MRMKIQDQIVQKSITVEMFNYSTFLLLIGRNLSTMTTIEQFPTETKSSCPMTFECGANIKNCSRERERGREIKEQRREVTSRKY